MRARRVTRDGGIAVRRARIAALVIVACLLGAAVAASAAPATLRVLLPIGGGYTEEDQQALATEFMRQRPDVRVDMEFVGWDALWDRIITSIAAGNAPDIIYIGSRWIPALADMGAIIPLDEYITQEKYDLYYPTVWDTVRYEGKIWGIVRAMSTKALLYNRGLFERYGVQPPTDWDEVLDAARKLHHPPTLYGFGLPGNRFVSTVTEFQNWLYANNGRITDEQGRATIDQPEAVEALDFYINGLGQYAQPSPVEWRREDLIRLFKSQTIGMYTDHVFSAIEAIGSGIDVGISMIPKGPRGVQPYATVLVTDSIAIPTQARNRDLAVEFALFMTSFDNQSKWDELLGFVPPMPQEASLPTFQQWYWRPFLEGIRYGVPEAVYIKDWEATQEAILTAMQKVLFKEATPEAALREAAQIINILQGFRQ
ncbi:ABC transporter substrate-binding protein [Geochorda subterranea]|uniref:Sugar ABC transporter substrate-binding protein n=1 Tax=Geochorda subterranea TaxID=3109564 RepID=A0ABZ1BLH0_9FIRM|nr:sugar ABC transporter substrate-binding protein [Limnochorda sp. LNt]WRP13675.1 sugar ABC transporter substrate-binding protein [Limnochorda sp. LNt]